MEKRKMNLDYIRILAMLFIICHHCIVNDFGLQNILKNSLYTEGKSINDVIILSFLNSCVVVGVNIFFLLSGYLGIKFKWNKLIALVIKTYVIYGIIAISGLITGNLIVDINFIKTILDPLDMYWFIMTYILIYFTSPLLNMIVESISINLSQKYILGICLICFTYGFFIDGRLHIHEGYSFLMGMVLYVLGGILKKWGTKIKNMWCCYIYILCALINTVIVVLCYVNQRGDYAWKMYSYNNILIVMESLAILFIFLNMKDEGENRILKQFAKGTFSVYLLHSTCWLTQIRKLPIDYLIGLKGFYIAILLLPIYAFIIYSICIVCDYIYERIYERFLVKRISKLANTIEIVVEKMGSYFSL